MDKPVRISIIVPIFNTEKYLHECIDSLLSQTLSDIEIILIDDGSTDNSGCICDQFRLKYSNIKVIHQVNKGQSAARNAGIKIASGEFLLFVDSDDYISPDACEVLYNNAIEHNVDLVWGDCINSIKLADEFYDKLYTGNDFLQASLKHKAYDIIPTIKLIRKSVFIDQNLWFIDGCFYEDQLYTLQMLLNKDISIFRLYFPFYFYRTNPESTTHIHNLKKGTDLVKVILQMINLSKQVDKDLKVYCDSVVGLAVYHLSVVYFKMSKDVKCEMNKYISNEILEYSSKTKFLTNRIKFQNYAFAHFRKMYAFIYTFISKIKNH